MEQRKIEALLQFYQTLTPERVADFGTFYAADAYFKDPFNEVRTLEAIREIFRRMFSQVHEPRFLVRETAGDERGLFLVWDMSFRMKAWHPQRPQLIHGASHLKFDGDGRVNYHRDYWDTGEELYAKLPVIGGAVRFLRGRLGEGGR